MVRLGGSIEARASCCARRQRRFFAFPVHDTARYHALLDVPQTRPSCRRETGIVAMRPHIHGYCTTAPAEGMPAQCCPSPLRNSTPTVPCPPPGTIRGRGIRHHGTGATVTTVTGTGVGVGRLRRRRRWRWRWRWHAAVRLFNGHTRVPCGKCPFLSCSPTPFDFQSRANA